MTAIIWDIKDACDTFKDLNELSEPDSNQTAFKDEASEKICGLNDEELLAVLGVDLKMQKCVNARINSNTIFPKECEGIDFTIPSYDTKQKLEKQKIEAPTYD